MIYRTNGGFYIQKLVITENEREGGIDGTNRRRKIVSPLYNCL